MFPERLQLTFGTLDFIHQRNLATFRIRLLLCLCNTLAIWTWSWDVNAKAISIISERYHGKLVSGCLVFVGLLEVVGASILNLAVGQIVSLWLTATFLAYAVWLYSFGALSSICPYNKEEIHESKH